MPEPGVGDGIDLFTGGRQGRGGGGRSSVLPDTLFFGCRWGTWGGDGDLGGSDRFSVRDMVEIRCLDGRVREMF